MGRRRGCEGERLLGFSLARSQERVNRSSLTFAGAAAAGVSETAPLFLSSFCYPLPFFLSSLVLLLSPRRESFWVVTEAESALSLPLFRGGMENQQNEPNFPIHLTRESFSSSSSLRRRQKLRLTMPKKRFHNVIIFRPLEPLTRLYAGMHMQKSMNPNYVDLSLAKTLRSYLPELHESLQKYEHWSSPFRLQICT